ncbi:hypothetical protein AX17_004051 [Amanita inopinata Kibby_2008]|nr:hypothetical protein AX17_004051 [Amanita inopinata Kibby_2008]
MISDYINHIRDDVLCHKFSQDGPSWHPAAKHIAQDIQEALKLPTWVKSGPYPRVYDGAVRLLDEVPTLAAASTPDIRQTTDTDTSSNLENRFRETFGTALIGCATVRLVLEDEEREYSPIPKESFLVVLLRNVLLYAYRDLCPLEDVLVSLPRHYSGEPVPALKFFSKSICVPFVMSIVATMPHRSEDENNSEHTEPDTSSDSSGSFTLPTPPSLSEWLDRMERPQPQEEDEDEEKKDEALPEFEAHFEAHPPSSKFPPYTCCIPILCMADDQQLPVLMSSLLYQRRVWRINEPLIGIGFSKYETEIRLYVGWLDDNTCSRSALPRIHFGEIDTTTVLDLGCPLTALAVSRALHLLEPSISAISESVKTLAPEIALETQSASPFSWRLDTHAVNEVSVSDGKESFENILGWMKGGDHLFNDPHTQKDGSQTTPSDTSTPRTQTVAGSRASSSTSPSSVHEALRVPDIQVESKLRAQDTNATDIPTFVSRKSCSEFAQKNVTDDTNMLRWMFNRHAVPRSLASDPEFFDEYKAITGFIWPEEWKTVDDLPSVDRALKPFFDELLNGVSELRRHRPHAIRYIKQENASLPPYLQILEQNISIVFHTFQAACGNVKHANNATVNEATWRHDHDTLLRHLFKQLANASDLDKRDSTLITSLETKIQFAKRDTLESGPSDDMIEKMQHLTIFPQYGELKKWTLLRGGQDSDAAAENTYRASVFQQLSSWNEHTKVAKMILRLGEDPSTGTCDVLGHLLVTVPSTLLNGLHGYQLVARRVEHGGKHNSHAAGGETEDENPSQTKHMPRSATKTARNLSVPSQPASKQAESEPETTRPYHIPAASLASTTIKLADGVDTLVAKTQDMKIANKSDFASLELPVIVVEHKRQSEQPGKATNQIRMYLTSTVKFLASLGITGIPVFGIQTDGRHAFLPAAVQRDDGIIHLFERQVEKVDISTPLGAWHLATVISRLADDHSKRLQDAFDSKKDSLQKDKSVLAAWTIDHQRGALVAQGKAKEPSKKSSEEKK